MRASVKLSYLWRGLPGHPIHPPLTDATIAYVVGGVLEVVDAPTLIINRELAAWYREADEEAETTLVSLAPSAFQRSIEA